VSLAEAQRKGFKVDWSDPVNKPVTPKVLGTTVYSNYPIEQVVEYIDWNPFFQVGPWRGRAGLSLQAELVLAALVASTTGSCTQQQLLSCAWLFKTAYGPPA
jgi:cobalamin-dependent methionine synthase I